MSKTLSESEISKREQYKKIIDSLDGRRKEVFLCILENSPICDKDIAEKTGIPINVVTPRRKELQGFRWIPLKGYELDPELQLIEFHSFQNDNSICLWKPVKVEGNYLEPEIKFQ